MNSWSLFACSRCRSGLSEETGRLVCSGCRAAFPIRDGMPDFLPELARQPGFAQWFMESRIAVWTYDWFLRSAFVRTLTRLRPSEERAYLERWCVPGEGPILDLACGTGRYTRFLAQAVSRDAVVVGVDVSAAMLRRARALAGSGTGGLMVFARASAQALPFTGDALAAVNCSGALHLFPDPAAAITEIGRVLRPGGTFTFLTMWRGSWGRGPRSLASRLDLRLFEEAELTEWMGIAGLEILDLTPREHVVLVAARKGQ